MFNIQFSDREDKQRLLLSLPASSERVKNVFNALANEEHPALQITAAETSVPHLHHYLTGKYVDRAQGIQELIFLNGRIEGLTGQEKDIFGAMLDIEKPFTFMEIVNLSCNMDKFILYPEVHNDAELGKAILEKEHTDIPEEPLPHTAYEQAGKTYADSHAGAFSESGYVVRTGEALEPLYDGKYLPDPSYDKKSLFLLRLCPANAAGYQNTRSLSLPATDEKLELVRKNLGVRDFDECRLVDITSTVGGLKDHLPSSYNVQKLNEFAAILSDKVMDGTEETVMRLFAALTAEMPEDIEAASEIAANLERYEVLTEEIKTPVDYAGHVLEKAQIHIDDEIRPFVDYEGFGKYRMQKDGVVQTDHGLILRNDRPIRQLPEELTTLKLFSPLYSQFYERTEWGDIADNATPLYTEEMSIFQDEILAAIEQERLDTEGGRGLAVYLDNELLKRRVHSMNPTVEEWNDCLWGVLEVQSYGPLSESELSSVKEEWCGQENDGWGERFEQRKIEINDGELYVSFWSPDKDFFIKTEQELKNQPEQGFGMRMQ